MRVYVYVCICACVRAWACVCVYIFLYIRIRMCACVYVYVVGALYAFILHICKCIELHQSLYRKIWSFFSFLLPYLSKHRGNALPCTDVFPPRLVDTALRTFNSSLTTGRLGVPISRTRYTPNCNCKEGGKRKSEKLLRRGDRAVKNSRKNK